MNIEYKGITYRGICWLSDPGHGWLSVPLALVQAAGVTEKITDYSYLSENGKRAYLEEDCDAGKLFSAIPTMWETAIPSKHSDRRSHVRYMPRFRAEMIRGTPSCKQ